MVVVVVCALTKDLCYLARVLSPWLSSLPVLSCCCFFFVVVVVVVVVAAVVVVVVVVVLVLHR